MGYERHTLRHSKYGGIDVLGWDTFPEGSVLEGQPRKTFLGNFESVEDAQKMYPEADSFSNAWSEPQVSLKHLPGEDDPVPGGMYPDDWTD